MCDYCVVFYLIVDKLLICYIFIRLAQEYTENDESSDNLAAKRKKEFSEFITKQFSMRRPSTSRKENSEACLKYASVLSASATATKVSGLTVSVSNI